MAALLSARRWRQRRDRRGSVLAIVAITAVPLTLGMGLSVDVTRTMLVRSRLSTAIDAAALAAARDMTNASPQSAAWTKEVTAMFWANFGQSASDPSVGFLGAKVTGPTITQVNSTTVQVTAQASVPTTFMQLAGKGFSTIPVSATNQAVRSQKGLEIALVLDNTGSMKGWPIQAVHTASSELVNILYAHAPDDTSQTGTDTQQNLWLSIVPFTAEVNIGPSRTGWLKAGSYNPNGGSYNSIYDPTNARTQQWMGCVMARTATHDDFTDATPSQSPFTPFVYPSTLGVYKAGGQVVTGDDDWSTGNITEANQTNLPDNTAVGPNLGCPNLPVMGLQPSRNAAMQVISQMVANFRGGTFINLGLQAGWWTLSPTWRGLWNAKYSQLPLDYGTLNMQKVIVLMTDGNNEWYDWPGGAPGSDTNPKDQTAGWQNDGDTDYAAYGRLKMNQMGLPGSVTQSNATAQINQAMSQMCTNIKKAGITIYTVLFNHDSSVSSSTQTLFQNCATSPQDYFLTPTAADLATAFSAIGGQLADVRLSQ